jgi:hypothetical protein
MNGEVFNSSADFKPNYSNRLTPNEFKNKIFKEQIQNFSKLPTDGKSS